MTAQLAAGKIYIKHIAGGSISNAMAQGFEPTADFSRVNEAGALTAFKRRHLDLANLFS